MAWDEHDVGPDAERPQVASDHARAVMWGAVAVVLLAIAGVLISVLQ